MVNTDNPLDKKLVLIDTCVIQHAGNKNESKANAVLQCLKNLTNEGYELGISEISVYESLNGLSGNDLAIVSSRLQAYKQKAVTVDVLRFAALLGSLYHDEKVDGIEIGDKIIAATAILEQGLVLTANHKDFPPPFFITERSMALPYKVKHYMQTLDIALYIPQFDLITRRINEKTYENKRRKIGFAS